MLRQELGYDLRAEGEGHASVVLAPAHGLLVRVRPQQVAEESLVWYIGGTHDATYLLHRL